MGLSILIEVKWLVGNGNSIPINYDFWLNVQNGVSTPIVNDNLDLENLIGMEAYIIIEN